MRATLLAVLVAVVAAGCGGEAETAAPAEPDAPEAPAPGAPAPPPASDRQPAPDLEGTTLDGAAVSLADFRGRPVLVNVWSSW